MTRFCTDASGWFGPVIADAAAPRVTQPDGRAAGADLAVMTGNVAQVFLTDQDWAQALQGIGAALRPRGYLVFETRRPARRAWEDWAAQAGPVVLAVPGSGLVEQRRQVTAVDLPFVSFRCTYTFRADGAVITSDSTLRFRGREEVESSLAARATGRWTSGKPQTGRARSSCSSPSAPPDRQDLRIHARPAAGRPRRI